MKRQASCKFTDDTTEDKKKCSKKAWHTFLNTILSVLDIRLLEGISSFLIPIVYKRRQERAIYGSFCKRALTPEQTKRLGQLVNRLQGKGLDLQLALCHAIREVLILDEPTTGLDP